jgi:hypothetical protein
MLTPCQTFAKNEGVAALDKALFTTKTRALKMIPVLCDECPEDAKRDCAKRAQSIVTPAGVIPPFGVFGGVFYE